MTSPLNHDTTVAYFQNNDNFGREIHFFQQEMAPLSTGQLAPNGNGNVFRAFRKAGLADLFAARGIDRVTISYVDNPLSHPLDPNLMQGEVAIQCIEREEGDHSMGVLVEREGKMEVVEYTEFDRSQKYKYAYSGQLGFDFAFFCQMGERELPLHWVEKAMDGTTVRKGEQFIFDCLPYAKKIHPVCVERATHYAPIKGPDSVEKARKSLVKR